MNFLDTYDIEPATTPAAAAPGAEPTLNEEVSQVVGQLGRLWGGFRKQSQTVFETARKEVGQVVSQAQKELTKLSTEPQPHDEAAASAPAKPAEDDPAPEAGPSSAPAEPADRDGPTTPTAPRHGRVPSVSLSASGLLAKLQSALPADLAARVQAQLPEGVRTGDLGALAAEFARVQRLTRAQAEEYVHRSEGLLRDAGEFLKDAVKVVPPPDGAAVPGVLWDGSDIWMLPVAPPPPAAKGKAREQQSAEGLRAVATRAEALLKQIKHDPAVLSVNPEADERAKQMWDEWLKAEVDNEEAGLESEQWKKAKEDALNDPVDGEALKKTMDTLVPSVLSEDIFWKRYFFRVQQVSKEEERRKAILQGTTENEEDFDWESDDEDATPAKPSTAEAIPAEAKPEAVPAPTAKASSTSTPATISPRRSESEDGSYDVVSSQVSNNGEIREEEPGKATAKGQDKKDNDEDEESDWE